MVPVSNRVHPCFKCSNTFKERIDMIEHLLKKHRISLPLGMDSSTDSLQSSNLASNGIRIRTDLLVNDEAPKSVLNPLSSPGHQNESEEQPSIKEDKESEVTLKKETVLSATINDRLQDSLKSPKLINTTTLMSPQITIDKSFPCFMCSKSFILKTEMLGHIKSEHDVDVSMALDEVNKSKAKANLNNSGQSENKDEGFPSGLLQIEPSSTFKILHPCFMCSESFENKQDMIKHILKIHGICLPAGPEINTAKENIPSTVNISDNMDDEKSIQIASSQIDVTRDVQQPSNLLLPIEMKSKIKKIFPCYICKHKSKERAEMLKHLKNTHNVDTDMVTAKAANRSRNLSNPITNQINKIWEARAFNARQSAQRGRLENFNEYKANPLCINSKRTFPCFLCPNKSTEREEMLNHLKSVHAVDVGAIQQNTAKSGGWQRQQSPMRTRSLSTVTTNRKIEIISISDTPQKNDVDAIQQNTKKYVFPQEPPPSRRKRRSSAVTTNRNNGFISISNAPENNDLDEMKNNETLTIPIIRKKAKLVEADKNAKPNGILGSSLPETTNHIPIKSYPCHECPFKSSDRAEMHNHLQSEHGIDTRSLVESGKNISPNTKINVKARTVINMPKTHRKLTHQTKTTINQSSVLPTVPQRNQFYPCYLCKFQSRDKIEMWKHLQTQHDVDTNAISSKVKEKRSTDFSTANKMKSTTYGRHPTITELPKAQEQTKQTQSRKKEKTQRIGKGSKRSNSNPTMNVNKNRLTPVANTSQVMEKTSTDYLTVNKTRSRTYKRHPTITELPEAQGKNKQTQSKNTEKTKSFGKGSKRNNSNSMMNVNKNELTPVATTDTSSNLEVNKSEGASKNTEVDEVYFCYCGVRASSQFALLCHIKSQHEDEAQEEGTKSLGVCQSPMDDSENQSSITDLPLRLLSKIYKKNVECLKENIKDFEMIVKCSGDTKRKNEDISQEKDHAESRDSGLATHTLDENEALNVEKNQVLPAASEKSNLCNGAKEEISTSDDAKRSVDSGITLCFENVPIIKDFESKRTCDIILAKENDTKRKTEDISQEKDHTESRDSGVTTHDLDENEALNVKRNQVLPGASEKSKLCIDAKEVISISVDVKPSVDSEITSCFENGPFIKDFESKGTCDIIPAKDNDTKKKPEDISQEKDHTQSRDGVVARHTLDEKEALNVEENKVLLAAGEKGKLCIDAKEVISISDNSTPSVDSEITSCLGNGPFIEDYKARTTFHIVPAKDNHSERNVGSLPCYICSKSFDDIQNMVDHLADDHQIAPKSKKSPSIMKNSGECP